MATTTTRTARTFVLLAETITRDERGDTVAGDHGIMLADGYVSMADTFGDEARDLLDRAHADSRDDVPSGMPADELAEVLLGAIDHTDERERETIYYGADLPDVGDDEPYVRAVVIRHDEREAGNASALALVWCLVTMAAAVPLLVAAHARVQAVAETLATLPV